MDLSIFPISFLVVLMLIGVGLWLCVPGLRHGWGLPAMVVLLTVGAWYVGDALYNDYAEYFREFGRDTLENAWWQVGLFLVAFLVLLRPVHHAINHRLHGRQSFAIKSYEKRLVNEGEVQQQIDRIFTLLLGMWIVLMLVALMRTDWDFGSLFIPYLTGHMEFPWARERVGGTYDSLLSLAQYLQIFLTAAFGLIFAISHNPWTRTMAGLCFFLSAPIFVFGRARNTMLAVVTPGLLAWVMIRLQTSWLVRALIIVTAFSGINFWMLFVLENRDEQIVTAMQSEESFEHASEKGGHKGLNMFQELAYINHFMKMGTYRPNWGARYWAEIVNPIPRGLWAGKPYVGIDYSAARGMSQGGYAEEQKEGVAATISTGMIGQGVVNFGPFFGPMFAALLMAVWVALLARQDLLSEDQPSRFLLFALGIILTFNMGRDITFIVTYPFFFGYAVVYYFKHNHGKRTEKEWLAVEKDREVEAAGQKADAGGGSTAGGNQVPMMEMRRVARWMPKRMRDEIAVENAALIAAHTKPPVEKPKRVRQLGVPYQNYRRHRG